MVLVAEGMIVAGAAALGAGIPLAISRIRSAHGADKVLVFAPVFEAVALAMFAAEHFFAATALAGIVPSWLPYPLFWTYFFGGALLAAAVSFILRRLVGWSALLLALFFVIIVATLDVPGIPKSFHDRLFWTLTARELSFAGGAMVLAGSAWVNRDSPLALLLRRVGRVIVALVMVFYGVEHFFFPHNVPGVPLEKMTPVWIPGAAAVAYFVGIVIIAGGVGLIVPRLARTSAAVAGTVLVVLTALFYGPIAVSEINTPLAVEGLNYVGDTLLFAATVILAGFGVEDFAIA